MRTVFRHLATLAIASLLTACATYKRLSTQDPSRSDKPQLRVAFGSCINEPETNIWSTIEATEPDIFLFLGDNIYLDKKDFGNKDAIRKRYRALFSNSGLQSLRASTEVFAIWDDHDFGPNDGDSTFPFAKQSREVFYETWSEQEGLYATNGESTELSIQRNGVQLILSDGRSYREEVGPNASYFGESQLDWIRKELLSHSGPTIFASGTPILSFQPPLEGLQRYTAEYAELQRAFQDHKGPLTIVSGDRHYGAILRSEMTLKTGPLYEVIASPLSANHRSIQNILLDPFQDCTLVNSDNFGVIDIFEDDGRYLLKLYLVDEAGNIRCERKVTYD